MKMASYEESSRFLLHTSEKFFRRDDSSLVFFYEKFGRLNGGVMDE